MNIKCVSGLAGELVAYKRSPVADRDAITSGWAIVRRAETAFADRAYSLHYLFDSGNGLGAEAGVYDLTLADATELWEARA